MVEQLAKDTVIVLGDSNLPVNSTDGVTVIRLETPAAMARELQATTNASLVEALNSAMSSKPVAGAGKRLHICGKDNGKLPVHDQGRNERCKCGSGKKFKRCCRLKNEKEELQCVIWR